MIPVLRRQRQVWISESEASLVYRATFRITRTTQGNCLKRVYMCVVV